MFIGRQQELALLDGALKPGACVALVGASGMGKSEIARAAIAGRKAVWVDCGGMSEEELAFRIAAAEGLETESSVAQALEDVEVLVLDDWTPELPVGEIRRHFNGAILVTSPVAPADISSLPVPPFAASEAVALFDAAANGVRLGAAAECDAGAVHEIIERVDGHPLGIVLAARHAAAVGAAEVARLMRAGAELTDAQRSPRQRSMALALDFSWERLSERNQTVLFLAARFERPVRVVTLAELAGLELNDVLDALRELTQCGAMRPGPFPRPVRLWGALALRRFAGTDAAKLADTLFDRAVDAARVSSEQHAVGPIDDIPSIWEAALVGHEARDREELGLIVDALLKWSHRFAPRRYLASNYLEDVAVWSASADALLRRVSFCRGNPEQHLAAIGAAQAVVVESSDHATVHFELAMGAAIRGDVTAALQHLHDTRQWEESFSALLLEAALRMFRDEHDEAARLLARLEQRETPSPAHAAVVAFHQIWTLPPGSRLERARAVVASLADAIPRVQALTHRCLADVLERDHGQYDEAQALREQMMALARRIDHARLVQDMHCELAWGAFCAGDIGGARTMVDVDHALLTAEARLRHACVLAMLACLDGDVAAARSALGDANRRVPHVPSVLGVFNIIDAAIALQCGEPLPNAPHAPSMQAAFTAGKLGHREQLDLYNDLRELRADPDWSARFACRWIEAHRSPFLERLAALDHRSERVVTLSDCTGCRVDGAWHHVPETSAAMLRLLATGRQVTFEEFKDAAWPGEVVPWDSLVNRINVRISKLRGLGLKAVLRKTSDGFVLDCSIYVEPA